MGNEIKGLQGGSSLVSFDVYSDTAGNEGVAVKDAGGAIAAKDVFDLTTVEGRQAYVQKLQSLGVRASDLPGFITSMEQNGFVTGLTSQEMSSLKSIASTVAAFSSSNFSSASTGNVQAQWAEFVTKTKVGSAMDVNALVEFVLREAYMQTNQDLQFYAEKVRFYNELKKNIRDELTTARKALSGMAGAAPEAAFDWSTYQSSASNGAGGKIAGPVDFSSTPVVSSTGEVQVGAAQTASGLSATKEGVETYIKNLEEKLNSVGDDAQLANVDLQNMLQKQQQTLQMMSNISKMLHDTALAIIRKIGG